MERKYVFCLTFNTLTTRGQWKCFEYDIKLNGTVLQLIEAFKDLTQDGSIDDTIDHETYTPRPRSNSAAGLLETFERRGSFSTERRGSFSTERLGSVDGERRRSIHEARYKALAARGRSQSTGGDLNKDDDSDNFEDTTIVTMPMRRRSSSVSSLSRSTSSRIKNGLDTTQQRRLVELSKPRSYAESYVLPSFKMDRTNAAAWSRPASASTPQIDGTLRQKSVGFSCARKARTDRLARSAPWRMAKKDDDDKNVSDVSGVKISALRSARISGRISDLATPRTRRPSCEAELEAAVQHVPKVNHKGEVLGETSTVSGVRKGALTSRISSRVAEMAMPVHRQCEDDVDFVDTRSAFRVKTGSQGRHSSVSTSGPSPPPKPQNQNLRRRRSSVAW